jgi:hypothetical protein
MTVPISTAEEKLNWEVEKLRKEVRNLGRTFFTAVILAVAGAVTAGYNIVKAVTDVSDYQQERDKLSSQIDELKQERDLMTSEFSSFKLELDALKSNSSLSPEQKLDLIPTLKPTLQYAAPDQVPHSSLPARVYVQYLNRDKASVDQVLQQLQASNFRVRAVGAERSSRSNVATVAYYYSDDVDEAKKLVLILKQLGVPRVKEEPIKLEGSARPRHFDIWLPPSDG